MKMHTLALIRVVFIHSVIISYITTAEDSFRTQTGSGRRWTDIVGVSFEQCKEECDARWACESVNYVRRKLLCEINAGNGSGDVTSSDLKPGYIHYRKTETPQKYNGCSCRENEKCTVIGSGVTSCSPVECGTAFYPNSVNISGNSNSIGSKLKATCKYFWRVSGFLDIPPSVIECDKSGMWIGFDGKKCGKEVFMVRKGLNRAYAAWKGIRESTNDTTCSAMVAGSTVACNDHFRDGDLDQWESLNISRVLLSVYKNEAEVQYVLFNGSGSTLSSWFAQENVLNSSWLDIGTEDVNYFSISGHQRIDNVNNCNVKRRFYINSKWSGCSNDEGWFMWSNPIDTPGCCAWAQPDSVADIIYSTVSTKAVFGRASEVGRADYFTVVIFSN